MRGSRLGASILVGRVAPGLAVRYLSHRPVVSWPAFLARLAELDAHADDARIDAIVGAAHATFAVFTRAARAVLSR